MQMRMIPVRKVPESFCGDDPAWAATRLRHSGLQQSFQGFPGAKAQIGQQFAVPQEEAPQELGNTPYFRDELNWNEFRRHGELKAYPLTGLPRVL